jgi:hypothetical protein
MENPTESSQGRFFKNHRYRILRGHFMRIVHFFLRFFLLLFILFVIAATIYVRIYGKSYVEGILNTSLQRNVVLGTASYHFPFGFQAEDVHIAQSYQGGEFLDIKKIIAQLSPDDAIFQGKLAFDIVILEEPSLVVKTAKGPENAVQGQEPEGEVAAPPSPPTITKEQNLKRQTEISVKHLLVKQGRLRYRDGLAEKGFSFDLRDVQLKAKKLTFPLRPGKSEFDMTAGLVKKGNPLSGGSVKSSGWIDAVQRDMDVSIEVVEANGAVGLTAKAVSKDNDMDVKGEINMKNLFLETDKKASSDASAVNDLVLNALSSSGIEIGAQFAFKTQMDNFRVGQVSFSGNVVTK